MGIDWGKINSISFTSGINQCTERFLFEQSSAESQLFVWRARSAASYLLKPRMIPQKSLSEWSGFNHTKE
jgi:hypothetical protein